LAAIFWFLLIGQRAEVAHGSERLGWLETAPGGQAGLHHARSAPAVRMGFTRRRSCWRGQGDPALADPALVRVALDGEIAHRNVLLSAHQSQANKRLLVWVSARRARWLVSRSTPPDRRDRFTKNRITESLSTHWR